MSLPTSLPTGSPTCSRRVVRSQRILLATRLVASLRSFATVVGYDVEADPEQSVLAGSSVLDDPATGCAAATAATTTESYPRDGPASERGRWRAIPSPIKCTAVATQHPPATSPTPAVLFVGWPYKAETPNSDTILSAPALCMSCVYGCPLSHA